MNFTSHKTHYHVIVRSVSDVTIQEAHSATLSVNSDKISLDPHVTDCGLFLRMTYKEIVVKFTAIA